MDYISKYFSWLFGEYFPWCRPACWAIADVGHRQGREALDQLRLGQLGGGLGGDAHRLSTTFGTRRMKASACGWISVT